tara:strand:+ start:13577 stop:14311 length:735 start_codon:yes stop_codon:yes gene_type:complete
MPCCKICFFRWTKAKNTCPCCRSNIFCDSEENKEIMHLKELLSHRTRIVRQVEQSYDELDVLRAKKRRVDLERQNIEKEINEEKEKLEKLLQVNGGTYKTINHLEIRIRNGLENIRVESTNRKAQVIHHIKQQCVFFLRATYKNPKRFEKFPYFSIAFKNFIIQNHKSKERMRFRNKVKSLTVRGCAIRQLFAHPDDDFDEYADMPSLEADHYYNIQNFIRNNRNSTNLERDFTNYFVNNIRWS